VLRPVVSPLLQEGDGGGFFRSKDTTSQTAQGTETAAQGTEAAAQGIDGGGGGTAFTMPSIE
jgi:hypothetical protein